jgi:hypothetical protein
MTSNDGSEVTTQKIGSNSAKTFLLRGAKPRRRGWSNFSLPPTEHWLRASTSRSETCHGRPAEMIGFCLAFERLDSKSGLGSNGPHKNPVPRQDAEHPAIVTLIKAVWHAVSVECFGHWAGRLTFSPSGNPHVLYS